MIKHTFWLTISLCFALNVFGWEVNTLKLKSGQEWLYKPPVLKEKLNGNLEALFNLHYGEDKSHDSLIKNTIKSLEEIFKNKESSIKDLNEEIKKFVRKERTFNGVCAAMITDIKRNVMDAFRESNEEISGEEVEYDTEDEIPNSCSEDEL